MFGTSGWGRKGVGRTFSGAALKDKVPRETVQCGASLPKLMTSECLSESIQKRLTTAPALPSPSLPWGLAELTASGSETEMCSSLSAAQKSFIQGEGRSRPNMASASQQARGAGRERSRLTEPTLLQSLYEKGKEKYHFASASLCTLGLTWRLFVLDSSWAKQQDAASFKVRKKKIH